MVLKIFVTQKFSVFAQKTENALKTRRATNKENKKQKENERKRNFFVVERKLGKQNENVERLKY